MHEHLSRVALLLEAGRAATNAVDGYRMQLAAVYSCRAVVEIMLEAAEKQEIKNPSEPPARWSRTEVEAYVSPQLPFFALIEKIRIHDFHRFGLIPPDAHAQEVFFGGPMKLVGQKGTAAIHVSPDGPVKLTSGNMQIKEQRPLLSRDGQFFDEESLTYVSLDEIISTFIGAAQKVVAEIAANAA